VELVIKIPEEVKQAFDYAENNDLKAGYYDLGGVIGAAIKNGTPLPKGHGKLIDAKEVYRKFFCRCLAGVAKEVLDETLTIIEADKTGSEEVCIKS